MPDQQKDYTGLFSQIIQKLIDVLGPDAVITKVRQIPGIVIDEKGTVTRLDGEPHKLVQSLINEFVELSDGVVEKTINPILATHPEMAKPMNEAPSEEALEPSDSSAAPTSEQAAQSSQPPEEQKQI